MLPLSLLLGCPTDPKADDTGEPARTCDDVEADFAAEAEAIRACDAPSDCGQELTGTSCGCTRNWVAREDADTTAFYALIAEAGDTCDLGLASTCDCPEAYGFDCVEDQCTWAYTTVSEPYPDCRAENGDAYEVGGLSLSGDTLIATVSYGGGCETHDFVTCWPDGAFAESSPVQAALELWHDAHGDACEAWITEDHEIDLAPLRRAYQLAYSSSTGTIVVHLGEHSATYTF
ncbi:MAG: hypothetical protein ACOZNI_04445 [Myxococcota bacterium]